MNLCNKHLTATAISCPNIALIKYWGNRDQNLNLPSNGSISMNLAGLETRTTVSFDPDLVSDQLSINGQPATPPALSRVSAFLDRVRERVGFTHFASVVSANNFPTGVGIASSASAFAALSLAATRAAGLELAERELSRLARLGSGSACRSIPGGFVEWQAGEDDQDSFAYSIAPPDHWDLADCIAVLSENPKQISSLEGHALADTSPLQAARVADAPRRLEVCRQAIRERDFMRLAEIVELDSNLMHAVMLTSTPRLIYWLPETLTILQEVSAWRRDGLPVCYTVDAGPNVHVLCTAADVNQVADRLLHIPGVAHVLKASMGGPTHLVLELY